ncbi:phosphoribosylaminoimidazole synthetase [Candidatus Omnitrophus magneticus]|uniref:Phosphoribosylformylglycinamidine cyclo-ligase n=1 Tax=Candidatus Omnitrophus magneticus TaxID=1609969 RepID=A0A0F0CKC1_9BACT|nr:phosphoribosylaminoimidazole synthetase [Candidatus Omnitrophus magneticus]
MSVNDCLCSGAKPIFFLDYFACGKLEEKVWNDVIKGIVKGCKEASCALIGGETAEMPGMYKEGDYDLAGFAVGIVDRKKIIDGKKITPGDIVLGIASSGFHSNGYSLVRKIFTKEEFKKNSSLFLKPTHIYVKPVLELSNLIEIKGIAHITGGGFYDNIPRIMPKNCKVVIKRASWEMPEVYKMLMKKTVLRDEELFRTFNMGIGMILVINKKNADKTVKTLLKYKLKSWVIGEVVKGERIVEII